MSKIFRREIYCVHSKMAWNLPYELEYQWGFRQYLAMRESQQMFPTQTTDRAAL